MPVKKGQCIGGIRTLEDVRQRCHVDEQGCWHWRMCFTKGLPQIALLTDGRMRSMTGMRASVILTGVKLSAKQFVWRNRFKCKSADCVNPEHASYGPRAMMIRHFSAVGIAHARPRTAKQLEVATKRLAKIDAETAARIRLEDGGLKEVAEKYGLTASQVWNIRTGKAWAPKGFSVFTALGK